MKPLLLLIFFFISIATEAQNIEFSDEIVSFNSDMLSNDDISTASAALHAEEMSRFKTSPIDMNSADVEQLSELLMLNPSQINRFIEYRNALGNLVDFYELQAIPGWNIELLRLIRPYVYVSINQIASDIFKNFTENRTGHIVFRSNFVFENDSNWQQGFAFRYRYSSGKNISISIAGENDPGEKMVFTEKQKGFDFTTGYCSYKSKGILRNLIIGDYAVNIGQGLVCRQSAGFGNPASVVGLKQEGSLMKPHQSFGESNFKRGVSCLLEKNNVNFLAFISSRNLDAYKYSYLSESDSFAVSSFDYSGIHTTNTSLERKHNCHEMIFGATLLYKSRHFNIGLNYSGTGYSLPIVPDSTMPYTCFYFKGKTLNNMSINYSLTSGNFHYFGETATDFGHFASINGIMISVNEKTSVGILHRSFSKAYSSFYASVIAAHQKPMNESGVYFCINNKFNSKRQVSLYWDWCKFPWLTYATDYPSGKAEAGLSFIFSPSKKSSFSVAAICKKDQQFFMNDSVSSNLGGFFTKKIRFESNYVLMNMLNLKTRMDLLSMKTSGNREEGALFFVNLTYKNLTKPYNFSFRFFWFDTKSYNSRLYMFENDIMNSYSIGCYYGSGSGFNAVGGVNLSKKSRLECSWYMSSYTTWENMLIKPVKKSSIKLQFSADF